MKISTAAAACCLAAMSLTTVTAIPLPKPTEVTGPSKGFAQVDVLPPLSIPSQASHIESVSKKHSAADDKVDPYVPSGLGRVPSAQPGPLVLSRRSIPDQAEHPISPSSVKDFVGTDPVSVQARSMPVETAQPTKLVVAVGDGPQRIAYEKSVPDGVQARSMPTETPRPSRSVLAVVTHPL